MTSYQLSRTDTKSKSFIQNIRDGFARFWPYLADDRIKLIVAFITILLNSLAGVISPYIIALATDKYIIARDPSGLIITVLQLGGLFLLTVVCGFFQARIMGAISQNTLLKLRNTLFSKIQSLPIAFFNQNKAGDLMSRLNNDADKLNQFLSESVIRFVGNFSVIFGIGIFIFFLNVKLAIVTLVSTVGIVVVTRALSPFIQRVNKQSLAAIGDFESNLQESLSNFRVIVAFNRRNYFQEKLESTNRANFSKNIRSEFANGIFKPIYDLAGYAAQIIVLIYGIYLIQNGELTVGLLIGFLSYTQKFYDPLRILGMIWANIQTSLAAWSRISEILVLESNLSVLPVDEK